MPTVTVSLWQDAVDGIIEGIIKPFGQEARIQTRNNRAPAAGSPDNIMEFTDFAVIPKMAFDTESGKTTFDGVGTEKVFSDTAYLEYIPNVTSEQFVLFDGRRYKIINVEDIGNIKGVLALQLEDLGAASKKATGA